MTYRRVRVLIDRLPPESATKTAMRDSLSDAQLAAYMDEHAEDADEGGHGPLSRSDMVLFDIHDQLKWLEYAVYAAQGAKPTQPKPRPRPGLVDESDKQQHAIRAKANSPAGIAYLNQIRDRRGE